MCIWLENEKKVQNLTKEISDSNKVNLTLLEKNNELLQEKEKSNEKYDNLCVLYKRSIKSLKKSESELQKAKEDLRESSDKMRAVLELGLAMGGAINEPKDNSKYENPPSRVIFEAKEGSAAGND